MDRAELALLLPGCLPRLRSVARRLCRHQPSDADELVQETCLRALESAASFKNGNLGGWLATILLNQRRQMIRRMVRDAGWPYPPAPEPCIGAESVTAPLETKRLLRLMGRMPPPMREAVVAIRVEGMTEREAAVALGIEVGTVKSRESRGRAWLTKRFKR